MHIPSYLRSVEKAFDLPEGALQTQTTGRGRPKKLYKYNVSEVRKAALLYLLQQNDHRKVFICRLCPYFGYRDHSSILYARDTARAHYKNQDVAFMPYYERITRLAI